MTADGELKAWTTAPPTDGQANAAVCALLAKAAKLPKSAISIEAGHTSRAKRLRVDSVTFEELFERLAANGYGP